MNEEEHCWVCGRTCDEVRADYEDDDMLDAWVFSDEELMEHEAILGGSYKVPICLVCQSLILKLGYDAANDTVSQCYVEVKEVEFKTPYKSPYEGGRGRH